MTRPRGRQTIDQELAARDAVVLKALRKAADAHTKCPTNADLGRALGLSHWQARDSVMRLRKSKLIALDYAGGGRRRATIVATGAKTMFSAAGNQTTVKKSDDPAPEPVMRGCLTCGRLFVSSWAGNRICYDCGRREEFGSGYGADA